MARLVRPVVSLLVTFLLAYGMALAVRDSRVAQGALAAVLVVAGTAMFLRAVGPCWTGHHFEMLVNDDGELLTEPVCVRCGYQNPPIDIG